MSSRKGNHGRNYSHGAANVTKLLHDQKGEPLALPAAEMDEEEVRVWKKLANAYLDEFVPGDEFLLLPYVRAIVRLERVTLELDREGYTLVNLRGTPVSNPKLLAANALASRIGILADRLGIVFSARQAKANDRATKAANKTSSSLRAVAESEGLLVGRGNER